MSSTPDRPENTSGPVPTSAPGSKGANFFQALFDFNFNHFVTPKIVKIVYVVGTILIGLLTLFLVLTSFRHFTGGFGASPLLGLIQLLGAPVLGLFYLAFLRMSLELYYAVIRLSEDVHHGPSRTI